MSVVIFQPSVGPHVQQAARALFEAGQLELLITSVRDNPTSLFQRSAAVFGSMIGRDFPAQFRRRRVTEVPIELVECHPFGEWMRIAAMAADRSGGLGDLVWEWAELSFDRIVSRRISRSLSGVYGFEHSSLETFKRARELGVSIAYDIPAPEVLYVHKLLEAEMEKFPELTPANFHQAKKKEDRRVFRRRMEWEFADVILVNSRFTRDSYERAGMPCGKVRIATLGAPPPVAAEVALASRPAERPLAFLWAGTFGIRKGAHYLLEAWRKGNLGRYATLTVCGALALPDRALYPLPEGVELCGSIPHEKLFDKYLQADALVFPTLCDGFGMVATEAWAHGLPVITTERAGVVDLLKPGENGLLVQPGDPVALRECLEWCISNRARLREMREASLATAAAWQWADYRRQHSEYLREAGIFKATS